MIFKKAKRRYPYFTQIKYIGDKTLEQVNIVYDMLSGMKWKKMPVTYGSIGSVIGFIFDPITGHDVIGIQASFNTPSWIEEAYEPVELYFGEDLFVRSF